MQDEPGGEDDARLGTNILRMLGSVFDGVRLEKLGDDLSPRLDNPVTTATANRLVVQAKRGVRKDTYLSLSQSKRSSMRVNCIAGMRIIHARMTKAEIAHFRPDDAERDNGQSAP